MPEQRLTTSSLYRQCRWLFLSNLRSRIACFRFANRYSFWGTGQPAAISFQPTANSGLTFCATSGDNLNCKLGLLLTSAASLCPKFLTGLACLRSPTLESNSSTDSGPELREQAVACSRG